MLTWTYDEVAAQFRRADGRFDHHRLIAEHGFPRPLPGFRNPLIWSRVAIAAWAAAPDGAPVAGYDPEAALRDEIARDEAFLSQHYGEGRA